MQSVYAFEPKTGAMPAKKIFRRQGTGKDTGYSTLLNAGVSCNDPGSPEEKPYHNERDKNIVCNSDDP